MPKKNILFIVSVFLVVIRASESNFIITAHDSTEADKGSPLKLSSVVTHDIDNFIKLHPDVKVEKLKGTNVSNRIQYVLGSRIPGDDLVAHGAQNYTWPHFQNVTVTLSYPSSGIGSQVTYVFIQVDQSSTNGEAYVVKGGLHQRVISIVIQAYSTFFLNYDAQIYGI